MRTLMLAVVLLALAPGRAEPAPIHQLTLSCFDTLLDPAQVITDTGCRGNGVWIYGVVEVSDTPALVRFALHLDGVLIGEALEPVPALRDLPPCPECLAGHYTGLGLGWRLPLPERCCFTHVVQGLASLEVVGGVDPAIAFTVLEPSPEPATLLLVGTGLALLGWRLRRAR